MHTKASQKLIYFLNSAWYNSDYSVDTLKEEMDLNEKSF